jgi:phenylalanyl-tRNA synthetase beta chain
VSYRELEQVAFTTLPDLLVKVSVFDIYKGNNIPEAKISIGLSFYLQDHKKTLTDKQIEKAMANLIAAFASRVGAEIRK